MEKTQGEDRPTESEPRISRGYSNYVLALLFVVYVFNFIDRQVLSILLQPIKEDLGVSDTFMGFLTGFAFVVFYTFAGIPIARIADRTSRRAVIALGLATWSLMTALSGTARMGWQLAAVVPAFTLSSKSGLSKDMPCRPSRNCFSSSTTAELDSFPIVAKEGSGRLYPARSSSFVSAVRGVPVPSVALGWQRRVDEQEDESRRPFSTEIPLVLILVRATKYSCIHRTN